MANILIIEDEKAVRENITDLLEIHGYNVVTANNGKQGLILTKTIRPDLIISDITMPVLDGFEMIQEIKLNKLLKNIPIIFLTARYKDEEVEKGKTLGAIAYIKKPFTNSDLIKTIKKIVI